MPVYKNNIEYDMAYQVEGGIQKPNSLNGMTLANEKPLICDSTWIPYMTPVNGFYNLWYGVPGATEIWNVFKEVWLEFNTIAPHYFYYGWGHCDNAEQIYLKNEALYCTLSTDIGTAQSFQRCNYFTYIDENEDIVNKVGFNLYSKNNSLLLGWTPNGRLAFGGPKGSNCTYILNAKSILDYGIGEIWENVYPGKIYVNQELYTLLQNNSTWVNNYNSLAETYDAQSTEFKYNYFNISQDGETLPWYTDKLTNVFGHYINLKRNNTEILETPFWKLYDVKDSITPNLTDSPVTRIGSATHGDITKNYSVTLSPVERTIRARLYFNTDNDQWNKFSVYPFYETRDCRWAKERNNDPDDAFNQAIYRQIKTIRYKPSTSSSWNTFTLPDYWDLVQQAHDHQNLDTLAWNLLLPISTTGYYDVEWTMIYGGEEEVTYNYDGTVNPYKIDLTRESTYFHIRNYKVTTALDNNVEYVDIQDPSQPFVLSMDVGSQICKRAENNWGYIQWLVVDQNENAVQTMSYHNFGTVYGEMMGNGKYTQVKNIVVDNVRRGNGGDWNYNWFNTDNDEFYNDGVLWWVSENRENFPDWCLGCARRPKTIYLHPTIYAMENHGFNGDYQGWTEDMYNWIINEGSSIIELPSNWKTLVPNYIGD